MNLTDVSRSFLMSTLVIIGFVCPDDVSAKKDYKRGRQQQQQQLNPQLDPSSRDVYDYYDPYTDPHSPARQWGRPAGPPSPNRDHSIFNPSVSDNSGNNVISSSSTFSIMCYACYYQYEQYHSQGAVNCTDVFSPTGIPPIPCTGPCALTGGDSAGGGRSTQLPPYVTVAILAAGVGGGFLIIIFIILFCKYCIRQEREIKRQFYSLQRASRCLGHYVSLDCTSSRDGDDDVIRRSSRRHSTSADDSSTAVGQSLAEDTHVDLTNDIDYAVAKYKESIEEVTSEGHTKIESTSCSFPENVLSPPSSGVNNPTKCPASRSATHSADGEIGGRVSGGGGGREGDGGVLSGTSDREGGSELESGTDRDESSGPGEKHVSFLLTAEKARSFGGYTDSKPYRTEGDYHQLKHVKIDRSPNLNSLANQRSLGSVIISERRCSSLDTGFKNTAPGATPRGSVFKAPAPSPQQAAVLSCKSPCSSATTHVQILNKNSPLMKLRAAGENFFGMQRYNSNNSVDNSNHAQMHLPNQQPQHIEFTTQQPQQLHISSQAQHQFRFANQQQQQIHQTQQHSQQLHRQKELIVVDVHDGPRDEARVVDKRSTLQLLAVPGTVTTQGNNKTSHVGNGWASRRVQPRLIREKSVHDDALLEARRQSSSLEICPPPLQRLSPLSTRRVRSYDEYRAAAAMGASGGSADTGGRDYDRNKITQFIRKPFFSNDMDDLVSASAEVGGGSGSGKSAVPGEQSKVRYNDTGSFEEVDEEKVEKLAKAVAENRRKCSVSQLSNASTLKAEGSLSKVGSREEEGEEDDDLKEVITQDYQDLWNLRATLEEEEEQYGGLINVEEVSLPDEQSPESPTPPVMHSFLTPGAKHIPGRRVLPERPTRQLESNTDGRAHDTRQTQGPKVSSGMSLLCPVDMVESRRQTYRNVITRRFSPQLGTSGQSTLPLPASTIHPNSDVASRAINSFDSFETDGDVSDTSRHDVTTTSFESTTTTTTTTTENTDSTGCGGGTEASGRRVPVHNDGVAGESRTAGSQVRCDGAYKSPEQRGMSQQRQLSLADVRSSPNSVSRSHSPTWNNGLPPLRESPTSVVSDPLSHSPSFVPSSLSAIDTLASDHAMLLLHDVTHRDRSSSLTSHDLASSSRDRSSSLTSRDPSSSSSTLLVVSVDHSRRPAAGVTNAVARTSASKKRRDYRNTERHMLADDSISEPGEVLARENTTQRGHGGEHDTPLSGESFDECPRLAPRRLSAAAALPRFLRHHLRASSSAPGLPPGVGRYGGRDYSVDEKTDALFNEFLRYDPALERGKSANASQRSGCNRFAVLHRWQRVHCKQMENSGGSDDIVPHHHHQHRESGKRHSSRRMVQSGGSLSGVGGGTGGPRRRAGYGSDGSCSASFRRPSPQDSIEEEQHQLIGAGEVL